MAATVTAYQQYGFSSPEELDEACSAAYAAMQESLTELKHTAVITCLIGKSPDVTQTNRGTCRSKYDT